MRTLFDNIKVRIAQLIRFPIVKFISKEGKVKVDKGVNIVNEVDRKEPYGFTTKPLSGSQATILSPNGDMFDGAVICISDKRYKVELQDGEVAIYNNKYSRIHLKQDGSIVVKAAKVVMESDKIELGTGTLEQIVNGKTFKTLFESHTHIGNLGAPTGPIVQPTLGILSETVKASK